MSRSSSAALWSCKSFWWFLCVSFSGSSEAIREVSSVVLRLTPGETILFDVPYTGLCLLGLFRSKIVRGGFIFFGFGLDSSDISGIVNWFRFCQEPSKPLLLFHFFCMDPRKFWFFGVKLFPIFWLGLLRTAAEYGLKFVVDFHFLLFLLARSSLIFPSVSLSSSIVGSSSWRLSLEDRISCLVSFDSWIIMWSLSVVFFLCFYWKGYVSLLKASSFSRLRLDSTPLRSSEPSYSWIVFFTSSNSSQTPFIRRPSPTWN